MPICDKWGIWFRNLKAAANFYVCLAVLSAILYFIVDAIAPFLGWWWTAVLKGVLVVLTGYYVFAAGMLTKTIYDEMVRTKKATAG